MLVASLVQVVSVVSVVLVGYLLFFPDEIAHGDKTNL